MRRRLEKIAAVAVLMHSSAAHPSELCGLRRHFTVASVADFTNEGGEVSTIKENLKLILTHLDSKGTRTFYKIDTVTKDRHLQLYAETDGGTLQKIYRPSDAVEHHYNATKIILALLQWTRKDQPRYEAREADPTGEMVATYVRSELQVTKSATSYAHLHPEMFGNVVIDSYRTQFNLNDEGEIVHARHDSQVRYFLPQTSDPMFTSQAKVEAKLVAEDTDGSLCSVAFLSAMPATLVEMPLRVVQDRELSLLKERQLLQGMHFEKTLLALKGQELSGLTNRSIENATLYLKHHPGAARRLVKMLDQQWSDRELAGTWLGILVAANTKESWAVLRQELKKQRHNRGRMEVLLNALLLAETADRLLVTSLQELVRQRATPEPLKKKARLVLHNLLEE